MEQVKLGQKKILISFRTTRKSKDENENDQQSSKQLTWPNR